MVREQRGVTLVEIVVALAIAGILASTVLFGRDQLRARQQFSQGVDQIVQMLAAARQETTGTVGRTDPLLGGTLTNEYVYGKLVSLTNNSSDIKVETVTISSTSSSSDVIPTIVNHDRNPYTEKIPWGVVSQGNKYIFFTLQKGGVVSTYTTTDPLQTPKKPPPAGSINGGMAQVVGDTSFRVQNANASMTADIYVDQNGNVTRRMN